MQNIDTKKFISFEFQPSSSSLCELRVGACVDQMMSKENKKDDVICPDAGTKCFCSECSLSTKQSTH